MTVNVSDSRPAAAGGRVAGEAAFRPVRGVQSRTAHDKRRKLLIREGRWQPFVPAQPVRDHVTAVRRATGLSVAQFAVLATLDQSTVNRIFTTGQPTVTAIVAAKIYAVTASSARPATGIVDATGARRRLQGLAWAGWTARSIAAETGLAALTISRIRNGTRVRISADTSRRIAAAHRTLLRGQPVQDTPARRKARTLAVRHGWVSSWAWDDDDIDDPAAGPKGLRPATGRA